MKIYLAASDRYFEATLHFAVVETDDHNRKQLVGASYVGLDTSVKAISAAFLEGRELHVEGHGRYQRSLLDKYRRLEKPIGLGDVTHGMIVNTRATINGLLEVKNDKDAYIFAIDGDMRRAIGKHVAHRFGLPSEWSWRYADLLRGCMKRLQVIRNPSFSMWEHLEVVKLTVNENEMLDIVETAIRKGGLPIPASKVEGMYVQGMSMNEYLRTNATILAQKLNEKQPRHSPDQPLDPSIATMKRVPFPAQAHMIQGLVNTLTYESSVICSGDMGTGKSMIAIGVSKVIHDQRQRNGAKRGTAVLLSAPSITLQKWRNKEIRGTVDAEVEIIRTTEDALALLRRVRAGYKPESLSFWLVGIDRAKLESEPYFGGNWKRIAGTTTYAWHCPDCGRVLMRYDKDAEEHVPLEWSDCAEGMPPSMEEIWQACRDHQLLPNGLPKGFAVKWKRSNRIMVCTNNKQVIPTIAENDQCYSQLWRPALRSRNETRNRPRANIARIFKKMKKFFDLAIVDEVHQCKAEGSGRGDAFHQIVRSAKKNLLLTGTLVNGKSTSVKEILWRTDPKALLEQGFNHTSGMVSWAERFGKLKQVITFREEVNDVGWVTRQRRVPQQPREQAGIAPQLTAQFLLHKAGFLELPDLGLPLVSLKEIPVFIDFDPEHGLKYAGFHEELKQECKRRSVLGSQGAWSRFIPATTNYADRPDLGAKVVFGAPNAPEKDGVVISAPAFPAERFHAKERQLVQIVKKELAEGRGVVIYNSYTDCYGMNERTRDVLQAHGIEATILDEPSPEKRQQRLETMAEQGVKVIVCNMKLVEVGLDLLPWPTTIYNQLSYEVSTVRQAARRAWRIGQERECRVYYLVYNGSQQMAQFLTIMSARGHALLVEGRLDRSELAKYARDSQSALASDLAECFADSEVADAWTKLAEKELEDVETVEEADFKQVLHTRIKALANETRRLCGLPPMVETEETRSAVTETFAETASEQVIGLATVKPSGETSLERTAVSHNAVKAVGVGTLGNVETGKVVYLPQPTRTGKEMERDHPHRGAVHTASGSSTSEKPKTYTIDVWKAEGQSKRRKQRQLAEGQLSFNFGL
ncbi:helicase-related protein [Brevibacillus dissolubilis]|uniref:helicase-related protein n=1 Tax=Brevibacillus dissolubilis TaxID=1844116 RepID=UPI00159B892A|nr:helicase-related protein [Brevibacillus dissolubilis]